VTGRVTRMSVTGVFNIHGTSKRETLPVEVTLAGSALQAAGSFTFPWSEFGMTAPSGGGFVNVTDKATMEFDLRLRRASAGPDGSARPEGALYVMLSSDATGLGPNLVVVVSRASSRLEAQPSGCGLWSRDRDRRSC